MPSQQTNKSTRTSKTSDAASSISDEASAAWQSSWQSWADTARTAATQQCDDASNLLTNSFERANSKMTNSFSDATSMGRDMTQATMQYCQTWAKGCEEISKSTLSLCQTMTQDCMSAFKSLLGARTLQDAISLQSDFLRQQYEKMVTESTRLGEVYTRTATEAAEPVKSQLQTFTQTVTSKYTPNNFSQPTSRAA